MADVYKFAWMNIAALSTESDLEGFINDARDPRIIFGFRAPFASILGRPEGVKNSRGHPCVLLKGEVKLLWDYQSDLPGSGTWLAPLVRRAWVYQETTLARRILFFTTHGVFFGCDEGANGEHPEWPAGGAAKGAPRRLLQFMADSNAKLVADAIAANVVPVAQMRELADELARRFDRAWESAVAAYTACQLTESTDRLMALSAVARELSSTKIMQKKYLAGLWDFRLSFQLAWMTTNGKETAPRMRVGNERYVAPSWSWASIEAPVKPANMIWYGNQYRALADVRAADVSLATNFEFGPVKAGWIRLWGCLKPISAFNIAPMNTSLTDAATGERLWFSTDTTEGYAIVRSRGGINKVVWMPLVLHIHGSMVECNLLVLTEVLPEEGFGGDGSFVRPGEKVYRRLGSGNFGRVPTLFRQDSLVLALGTYPEDDDMEEVARGFERDETGYQEFVVI
ncbi:hypothetical protein GQ53DRAFT_851452 [Thozetella sp. PMI_491]|nr:hypothetical protein GQ53DRAFT_851452 [Thozetella sp. PMI_491]